MEGNTKQQKMEEDIENLKEAHSFIKDELHYIKDDFTEMKASLCRVKRNSLITGLVLTAVVVTSAAGFLKRKFKK